MQTPSRHHLELQDRRDYTPADRAARTCWFCQAVPGFLQDPVAAVAEWYRYRIVACLVTSSIPVPLKTRRVGQRCTLNLSRLKRPPVGVVW
ncbi:hypothetical protein TNCV_3705701 [Trichonephila clavipes]|nr:hypothetical protein TNCV_3705701 [Trichonephila clavipes]